MSIIRISLVRVCISRLKLLGNTALFYAENVEVLSNLISKGADINIQNNQGDTPLIDAVRKERVEIVNELIRFGADTTTKSNSKTALDIAISKHWWKSENGAAIKKLLQSK